MSSRTSRRSGTKGPKAWIKRRQAYRATLDRRKDKSKGA